MTTDWRIRSFLVLLLFPSPALASRDGAAIAEGYAKAIQYGFVALMVSLAIGIATGLLLTRGKKRHLFRVLCASIGITLLVDAGLVVAWIVTLKIEIEHDVAHERQLQPFRKLSRETVEKSRPGEVKHVLSDLLRDVPATERSEKSVIVASDFMEHMSWHPVGWTAEDTTALANFGDSAFPGDVLAANILGHAIAIEWMNGRKETRLNCQGQWASVCIRVIVDRMSTSCFRQQIPAEELPACTPAALSEARERFSVPGPVSVTGQSN